MNELKFPDKFLFGTAVASYQVEGGIIIMIGQFGKINLILFA